MSNTKGHVALLGVGRTGFDLALAAALLLETRELLERLGWEVFGGDSVITEPENVTDYVNQLRVQDVDALVFQTCTVADGRFVVNAVTEVDVPIVIWSLPEEKLGDRLRLNSLTGGNIATSVLKRLGVDFHFVYRHPRDPQAATEIGAWLSAVKAVVNLKNSVIGQVGNAPPGFFTSSVDSLVLKNALGVHLVQIAQDEVFLRADKIDEQKCEEIRRSDKCVVRGTERLNPAEHMGSIRAYFGLRSIVDEFNLSAVAVRCWPEFFTRYGCAPCSVLSRLIDDGIPASCEADVLGAISMLFHYYLAHEPTYLGDLVHIDRDQNTGVFWHCGVGAFSLASEKTGPIAGVQPARGIGFALDNALKSGIVTIFRLGIADGRFRMVIIRGTALDAPNRFNGTSVEVRFEASAETILNKVIGDGFEHHYALVWADVAVALVHAARLLRLPVTVL